MSGWKTGEVYVYGMHITPYEKGNIFNKDPLRVRKLLLHRYEINKIEAKLKGKRTDPGTSEGLFQGQSGKNRDRHGTWQKAL